MKKIIDIVPELTDLTQSGKIEWEYMDDAPCLTCSYNNDNLILCKTETDSGIQVISLNYTKENEVIGDFIKWEENTNTVEYRIADKLYAAAEYNKVLTTC